jgi:hypothetical protein
MPGNGLRLLLFDNCTVVPCDNATPFATGVASIGCGVTEARVVRVHAAEVRLLPSGRHGTQAHQDERPVETREAAGSTPASSARGRGVAGTCLASNQVSWVRSPPSARVRRCEEAGYFRLLIGGSHSHVAFFESVLVVPLRHQSSTGRTPPSYRGERGSSPRGGSMQRKPL